MTVPSKNEIKADRRPSSIYRSVDNRVVVTTGLIFDYLSSFQLNINYSFFC